MIELKFSDELMRQVETTSASKCPDGVDSALIDFDDKGTVHVMKRDADGKLLEDLTVKESIEVTERKSYYEELSEEYNNLMINKEKAAMRSNIVIGAMLLLVITVFVLVQFM